MALPPRPGNSKIFIAERLTSKNETLAFHGRRLNCNDHFFLVTLEMV